MSTEKKSLIKKLLSLNLALVIVLTSFGFVKASTITIDGNGATLPNGDTSVSIDWDIYVASYIDLQEYTSEFNIVIKTVKILSNVQDVE